MDRSGRRVLHRLKQRCSFLMSRLRGLGLRGEMGWNNLAFDVLVSIGELVIGGVTLSKSKALTRLDMCALRQAGISVVRTPSYPRASSHSSNHG